MINLEDAAKQEDQLWTILELLRKGEDITFACEEWWGITENNSII
jgi:hypothetical protein